MGFNTVFHRKLNVARIGLQDIGVGVEMESGLMCGHCKHYSQTVRQKIGVVETVKLVVTYRPRPWATRDIGVGKGSSYMHQNEHRKCVIS